MQNFYIFLDIDGVMWDFKTLRQEKKSLIRTLINGAVSEQSLDALHYLINILKQNYNPVLVISSERRRDLAKVKKLLREDWLNCEFDTTGLQKFKTRGQLVKEYLQVVQEEVNFLIMDDFIGTYKNHFDMKKVLKTSLLGGALSRERINKHLGLMNCDKEDYEIFGN